MGVKDRTADPVLLSVVVPLRDEGPNLRALHEEIVAALQASNEWEIVFVDDGSTDEGPDVLRKLAREDPRVRIVTPSTGHSLATA